jgi:hypothetical protein
MVSETDPIGRRLGLLCLSTRHGNAPRGQIDLLFTM